MIVSINGNITDEKKACISVTGKSFLFGFAVTERIRTYNNKVFRLDDHLARLYVSADVIELKPKWSFKRTREVLVKALEKNKDKNVVIRVILTSDHVIVTVEKLREKSQSFYKKGVKIISYLGRRNTPRAKVLGDLFCYLAKKHAENCGVYEALLVDPKKYYIRECAYANIFWVNGGQLYATNKNILFGITRDTVIEMAKMDNPCQFEGIKLKTLMNADEVFITQTTSGILPVVGIDGHKVGNGHPGKVTKKLMKQFEKLVWGK